MVLLLIFLEFIENSFARTCELCEKRACIKEAVEVVGGINILEKTEDAENLREELGGSSVAGYVPLRDSGRRGLSRSN